MRRKSSRFYIIPCSCRRGWVMHHGKLKRCKVKQCKRGKIYIPIHMPGDGFWH